MTEREWLASYDPVVMLRHLDPEGPHPDAAQRKPRPVPPSDRKMRLFCCACARIGTPETFNKHYRHVEDEPDWHDWVDPPAIVARRWCNTSLHAGLTRQQAADLLREIFGNPWRPSPILYWPASAGPTWSDLQHIPNISWLTPDVLSIARGAYEENNARDGRLDSLRLMVLADAIEEAGCPMEVECPIDHKWKGVKIREGFDAVQAVIDWGKRQKECKCGGLGKLSNPLLTHLRDRGPHVRGCWALDLILGQ